MILTRCFILCLRNIIGHFGQHIFFCGIKNKKFPSVVQGTNVPRLILSWERMFHGMNGSGNEWERRVLETNSLENECS